MQFLLRDGGDKEAAVRQFTAQWSAFKTVTRVIAALFHAIDRIEMALATLALKLLHIRQLNITDYVTAILHLVDQHREGLPVCRYNVYLQSCICGLTVTRLFVCLFLYTGALLKHLLRF